MSLRVVACVLTFFCRRHETECKVQGLIHARESGLRYMPAGKQASEAPAAYEPVQLGMESVEPG